MSRAELERRRAALAAKRAKLADRQKDRLKQRISDAGRDAAPAIPPRQHSGPIPLSATQKRLWFLDQLFPGNPAYHMPICLRIKGPFEVEGLRWTVTQMLRRHEILRTAYPTQKDGPGRGEPEQTIHAEVTPHIEVRSLDGTPAQKELQLKTGISDFLQQPFDLAAYPLIKFLVLVVSDRDHVLVVNQHHILSDGFSMGVFTQEMVLLYAQWAKTKVAGETPKPLPPLPLQFADYAVWQEQWMQSQDCTKQLAWWQDRLKGLTMALSLPTDRPRPLLQSHRGLSLSCVLDATLSKALIDLGKSEEATLFMVLLTGYYALLHQLTGQRDILTGTHIANRERPELLPLIGFFANTLPLHGDLHPPTQGKLSYRLLLQRIRAMTLGVFDNQDMPFEKLVEVLAPPRDPGRSPLFQAFFVLQNAAGKTIEHQQFQRETASGALPVMGGQLSLTQLDSGIQTTRYELQATAVEQDGQIGITLTADAALYQRETIARWLERYRDILVDMTEDADRPVPAPANPPGPATAPQVEPTTMTTCVPPTSNTERRLAAIWQDILGEPVEDIHSNFFDLGGHSFALTKLRAHMTDRLGKDLTLVQLFLNPTIAAQASLISLSDPAFTLPPED